MGCGAIQLKSIEQAHQSLEQRLKSKLNQIKSNSNIVITSTTFLSLEELIKIQNSSFQIEEQLSFTSIYQLEAGEANLLSKQRRAIWKLALFQYFEDLDFHSRHQFTENPIPINQTTKNRFYEISLDVNRTFPSINIINRQTLSLVLQNITLYFQGVGYTQGMNFYIGFLLLCGFSSHEAYEIFIRLSYNKKFLIIRNFTEGFKNVNACIGALTKWIQNSSNIKLKLVIEKIESFGLNLFLFIFSWFLSYFLYNLNIRASVLIWDFLLTSQFAEKNLNEEDNANRKSELLSFGNGFSSAINIALNILIVLSDNILSSQSIEEVMVILRHESIQESIDQQKIERILNLCRHQPLITWSQFVILTQSNDIELYNLIKSADGWNTNKNTRQSFISFFDQCKFVKRESKQKIINVKSSIIS